MLACLFYSIVIFVLQLFVYYAIYLYTSLPKYIALPLPTEFRLATVLRTRGEVLETIQIVIEWEHEVHPHLQSIIRQRHKNFQTKKLAISQKLLVHTKG